MNNADAVSLIRHIISTKSEGQTIEVKAANGGTPKVYDTLSSFSNQMDGGTIVFGIDENASFELTGVFDAQALQKGIVEQGKEMTPQIRPEFEHVTYEGKQVVLAYVAGLAMNLRPAYRTASGPQKGACVRSGDADLRMTQTELYEIEAFKAGLRDDYEVPVASGASMLDQVKVNEFVARAKSDRPHMERRPTGKVLELLGAQRDGRPTVAGLLTLSDYPQQALPNLCVTAIAVPGTSIRQDESGERFLDNKRLEGPIDEMIEATMSFVRRNTKTRVVVVEGKRRDIPEYPENAVREIITNALMHRDYGPYSNGTPVRLVIYSDRLECWNPGGIYGGQSVDDLGRVNIQTRNSTLVTLLEVQGVAENRHSGIPVIRDEMSEAGLRPPVFLDRRGGFTVTLYNEPEAPGNRSIAGAKKDVENELLSYCAIPRSRAEISEHLNLNPAYVSNSYIQPLVARGDLQMTIPDKPRSKFQRFYADRGSR